MLTKSSRNDTTGTTALPLRRTRIINTIHRCQTTSGAFEAQQTAVYTRCELDKDALLHSKAGFRMRQVPVQPLPNAGCSVKTSTKLFSVYPSWVRPVPAEDDSLIDHLGLGGDDSGSMQLKLLSSIKG